MHFSTGNAMSTKHTVVVIGGGPAGMTAASRVKRLKPEYRVVVFEKSKYVSYAACGIPYYIGGHVDSIEKLVHYPARFFREKRGIEVYTETAVTDIDDETVYAISKDGETIRVSWDTLVIATGARPKKPPINGVDLEGVLTLRILEDAERARRLVSSAEKVAVIGGGYIGVEVAENLARLGKKVTIIEMLPHIMPTLDEDMAEFIEKELRENGVEVKTGEKVVEIAGKDKAEKVVTEKSSYSVDLVFLAVGVEPDVNLAEKLSLEKGYAGAVKVDKRLRTSMENVYAAGDVAETFNIVTGKPDWIPLATTANKMGYVAGSNVVGRSIEFPGVVGTAITKAFRLGIARTGLTEKQARKHGYDPISALVTTKTRPGYYPGGKNIHVKVIADRGSGKLLGAQAVGEENVLARINAFASLLFKGATVTDLFFDDLAYAPPFSTVWDPLVISARILMRKLL